MSGVIDHMNVFPSVRLQFGFGRHNSIGDPITQDKVMPFLGEKFLTSDDTPPVRVQATAQFSPKIGDLAFEKNCMYRLMPFPKREPTFASSIRSPVGAWNGDVDANSQAKSQQ